MTSGTEHEFYCIHSSYTKDFGDVGVSLLRLPGRFSGYFGHDILGSCVPLHIVAVMTGVATQLIYVARTYKHQVLLTNLP